MRFTANLLATLPAAGSSDPSPTIPGLRLTHRLHRHTADDRSRATPAPATPAYDPTWAGAMLTGAGYRTVVGSIDIPALRLPPDANASALHAVSAWVGIDGGAACPHALLQVGVDMYLSKGATQYWAWFGWWPNSPTYLSDFAMRAGDTVSLNVSAHSLTSATLSLLNTRTGQLDRASMAAVDEAALLCGSHAEWIVEDFWAGHGVPLADFGAITFSGTRFVTDTGVKGGLERARVTGVRERKGAVPVIACRARGVEVVGCEYRWPENSSDVVY